MSSEIFWLDLSSKCADPLCWAFQQVRFELVKTIDPNKFDNSDSKIKEIAKRVLIGIGALFALTIGIGYTIATVLALGTLSKIFKAIGFALQKNNFTHIRTETPERVINGLPKVATWNILGVSGGLHYDHGGTVKFWSRFNQIIEKIRREDADVVVLQEVYDGAFAKAIAQELQGDFAHIYTYLGKGVIGNGGGVMVLSKCAVHSFENEDFHNNKWTLRRGFATIEVKRRPEDALPCARIIGTHLIDGNDAKAKTKRVEQVAQIVNSLANRTLALPTVLVGDSNIERDSEEGATLTRYVRHGYLDNTPTCTNRLTAQWYGTLPSEPDEIIDIISLFKRVVLPDGRVLPVVEEGIEIADCHRIEAFDERFDTKTALSDHRGLGAQLVEHIRQ